MARLRLTCFMYFTGYIYGKELQQMNNKKK